MTIRDIAVGLDGSNDSADALRWAAGLAAATSATVRAVSSWQMPLIASLPSMVGGLPSQAFMANHAAEQMSTALAAAGVDGDLAADVRQGHPGEVLAGETAIADLVVVGRTGSGRRSGVSRLAQAVLGSVARHCIHHASGPVAAIPSGGKWVDNPSVIVGVDGSAGSHAALTWAVNQLPATATIHAVLAVPPYLDGLLAVDPHVLDRAAETARRDLDEAIEVAVSSTTSGALDRIERHVVNNTARHALVEPGFAVDMVVVGERGRGALASRMLGSVSDHVVRYAPCPVIVVPASEKATK